VTFFELFKVFSNPEGVISPRKARAQSEASPSIWHFSIAAKHLNVP
jgi:hypothetical protein